MSEGQPLRVLDLFSGIGGFSLGFRRAGGFRTVAFCEINPFCRRVLAKHWPGVPILEDVTTADFPDADVIAAGFPCQDISLAGPGTGLAGPRSGLFRHVVRAIRVVRPLYVLLENVAALLGRGMGTVLGDLAECGYDAEWDCVSAAAAGAHHLRDRIWIVAYPGISGLALPQPAGQSEPPKTTTYVREAVAQCTRRSPESDVVRTLHGVPGRVDRIGALGNSVYPAIPELIGSAIIQAEATQARDAA